MLSRFDKDIFVHDINYHDDNIYCAFSFFVVLIYHYFRIQLDGLSKLTWYETFIPLLLMKVMSRHIYFVSVVDLFHRVFFLFVSCSVGGCLAI